jgi:aminomuconate-semialdehyde/2-hydroxymuconate-6-semialdehyde dehydrogenase
VIIAMQTDKYLKNYIDGKLAPASSGHFLDNINPATGKVYTHFPDSNEEDLQKAIEAAERARPAWAAMDPQKRFRMLMRIADIIEQNSDAFARAETIDTGKPLSMSHSVDIPRAYAHFRFFASSILHDSNEAFHLQNEATTYTLRQPIGIIGCISPWNLPLYQLSWKVAAALACGNCVIAKTSEWSPVTAHLLSKACMEAQLPQGVLNILFGQDQVLDLAIARHPKIEAISFTGDLEKGQKILQAGIQHVKKLQLNMGGKNANIIFEDCDFDQMIINTLRSSFSNNGQHHYACSRIYVEESLYEKFKTEFIKRTSFLKIGDPFSKITDLGALISREHMEKIQSYVALAQKEGGTVLYGGKKIDLPGDLEEGLFFRPAIIEDLPPACHTNQEEIFGPVVTLSPFVNEAEAIQLANSTNYGLAASVWSKDISKASRISNQLKSGVIWINGWMVQDLRAPFGGIQMSGHDKEGGLDSLRFFSNTKSIAIKY